MERTIRVTGKGRLSVRPDTTRLIATTCPEIQIEYTVAEPEKCKNELLADAVADSVKKADVLTKAAGVTLGDIVNIDYSWAELEFVSRPMNSMMLEECCMRSCEDSYDIDINPDDLDVTDSVTVVWALV